MADMIRELPCDGNGICMSCKTKPDAEEALLTCRTCAAPWHVACLSLPSRPESLSDVVQWDCPDCSSPSSQLPNARSSAGPASGGDLVEAVRAIESDPALTTMEKARKRQALLMGGKTAPLVADGDTNGNGDNVLDILDHKLNCSFCMQLPDRPVTTPCGHNFCLRCFQKWVAQGKRTCANCRGHIPSGMAQQPRINAALVVAIRMAKIAESRNAGRPVKVYQYLHNQDRPDKAFTTERAKKGGKANACCGKVFVTVPSDHFGPILAENDPVRKTGVLVGELWEDRQECRQWGVHFHHVAGICGQSRHGAQSVALSGGYVDDEDHGEWFLYTGSGGRDLSRNKRTNKQHSFDQKFEKSNEALRVSCQQGYPVRVVRSHKEKRSSYAPEGGVRYDGIYRIEKCWRKKGQQGYKVCRFLFARCDNEPAPWTSDNHGDYPRPLPVIPELEDATDITEREGQPSWDYDEEKRCWMWKKPPPKSRKMNSANIEGTKNTRKAKGQGKNETVREKLLKEFRCQICRKVMVDPLSTPCGHNFCKSCLEAVFAGQSFTRQRTCQGRRVLRDQKIVMKCPSCTNDIAEFLQNPQVNRELMGVIQSLLRITSETEKLDILSDQENNPDSRSCNEIDQIFEEYKDDDDL